MFGSTLSPFRTFPTWKRGLGSYSANPGLQPRIQYLAQAEGLLDLAGFACAADHPPSTRGQGANAGCRPTTRRPGPFHRRGCANRCSGGSRRGSRTPLADGPGGGGRRRRRRRRPTSTVSTLARGRSLTGLSVNYARVRQVAQNPDEKPALCLQRLAEAVTQYPRLDPASPAPSRATVVATHFLSQSSPIPGKKNSRRPKRVPKLPFPTCRPWH